MGKLTVSFAPRQVCVLSCGDGHMVDVIDVGDTLEMWLYHKDYGVKTLMFGLCKDKISSELDEITRMIEANLASGSYLADYDEEYLD